MRGHVTKADARRPVGCIGGLGCGQPESEPRCRPYSPDLDGAPYWCHERDRLRFAAISFCPSAQRAGLGGPTGVLGDGRGQMSRGLLHLKPVRMGCAKTACGEFLC